MPSALVFAHAVLEVEHRIFLVGAFFVFSGSVDIAAPFGFLYVGVVFAFAHASVGHVFVEGVVGGFFLAFRYFYAACHAAAAVECFGSRIHHRHAVHQEEIVVEARHERVGGSTPHAFVVACHVVLLAADVHFHVFGFWCCKAEICARRVVDAWICCFRHVGFCREGIVGSCSGRHHAGQKDDGCKDFCFHRVFRVLCKVTP